MTEPSLHISMQILVNFNSMKIGRKSWKYARAILGRSRALSQIYQWSSSPKFMYKCMRDINDSNFLHLYTPFLSDGMALRAAKYIGDLLAQLNDGYNALTDMQGDAVVGTSPPQNFETLRFTSTGLKSSWFLIDPGFHFCVTLQGWMRRK